MPRRVLGVLHRVAGVPRRILGVLHRVAGVPHSVLGVLHRVVGVPHSVLGVLHRVVGVPHRVLGVLHRVVGVPHRVLGILCHRSCGTGPLADLNPSATLRACDPAPVPRRVGALSSMVWVAPSRVRLVPSMAG